MLPYIHGIRKTFGLKKCYAKLMFVLLNMLNKYVSELLNTMCLSALTTKM